MTEKSNKEASAAVQTFDIVIIGGGMVGASLAAALLPAAQSLDLQIAMIESQPLPDDDLTVYQPSYDARATALSYGTRSLYEHIGVWPVIAEQATPITHIHVSVLASIGTAGVPGVGLIMLSMVFAQVGLPIEGIGLILGVDRLLDMIRTAVNISGDAVVSVVVAKSENQLDTTIYDDPLAGTVDDAGVHFDPAAERDLAAGIEQTHNRS